MATQTAKGPILFAVICAYLILKCLWRLIVPGGSYSMPPWPLISMGFDLLLLVLLFVLRPQVPAATSASPAYIRFTTPLFAGGIIAVVIMFLIRFSGDTGWWTGHLINGN